MFDATGNFATYKHDAAGDGTFELNQARTHTKANEIATIAGASTYTTNDANGNMTKVVKPDNWSAAYTLVYDAWNRLVQVKDGSTVVATYSYNGLNHRIKKAVGNEAREFYFNNNWQCVEEYVGSTCDARYVWGLRYIDDLITYRKGATDLYSLADPNWNVVAITNTSGVVQERVTYDSFGKATFHDASFTVRSTSSYAWPRTFTGQVLDKESGMMLYRNRFYHAGLGRFVTRDPIGYFTILYVDGENVPFYEIEDVSLTRYCKNNLAAYQDPFGTQTSLASCFKSLTIFCVCISTGCFKVGQLAKLYTGKNKGAALVRTLEKFGATVVKGGKGSHTKIIIGGNTQTVPQSPGLGTAAAILETAVAALC